jgi:hypothetical protein
MKHNHDDWHIDASGRPYARKAAATGRDPMLGAACGDKKVDGFFDGLVTLLYLIGFGAVAVFALASLGYIEVPERFQQNTPTTSVPAPSQCDK